MSIAGAREHLRASQNSLYDLLGRDAFCQHPPLVRLAHDARESIELAIHELDGPLLSDENVPVTVEEGERAKGTVGR